MCGAMALKGSSKNAPSRPSPKPSAKVEAALEALERANLRKTPQRLAIVRAFADDPSHPTAQVIFDRLRRELPTMSFATVYNTLAALERTGSCRTLRIDGPAGDSGTRFDPNVEPHDHAVCDRCGAVRDVPRDDERKAPALHGFRIRAVERLYRGECAHCRASA
jgi:Fe2+ or Zn2+ uptake regulation protein